MACEIRIIYRDRVATIFDKVAADYRIAKWVDPTGRMMLGLPPFNEARHAPALYVMPAIAIGVTGTAFVLTALTQGRAGVRRLLQRLTWWRVGLKSPTMWFASGVVVQGMLALVMFTVLTTSMAFVFTRLFNNTQASLLLCILLHGSVDGSITYLQVLADRGIISADAAGNITGIGMLLAAPCWASGRARSGRAG